MTGNQAGWDLNHSRSDLDLLENVNCLDKYSVKLNDLDLLCFHRAG